MKNKKLLAALMALLLPIAVMAQTAFKGQLRISNERWSVYADRIVGTTAMRVADFANAGVNYARNHKKNPTADYSIEVHNGVNVYPVHVIGPASDLASSYDGVATILFPASFPPVTSTSISL